MTPTACPAAREVAPDLALDLLSGTDRASVLAHLEGCTDCRALVRDLAGLADSLLLLAPPAEPPPGFEGRVLAAMGAMPGAGAGGWRRRRARVAPWAAAAAILVAAVGGWALGRAGAGDDGSVAAAAPFLGRAGATTGHAVLVEGGEGPDAMVCAFTDRRVRGAYDVEVVLDGGRVVPVGSFEATSSPSAWTTDLQEGVDVDDVGRVRVRSPDGTVRSTATF